MHNLNRQRILTSIFEGITNRMPGITLILTCSPQFTKWSEQLRHNCPPIIPKFEKDLVSSPRTSQSSQFRNAMPSSTTHATFNQISRPEQLPFFSNPSLSGENNLPSLHLDTNSLLAPTRCRRRHHDRRAPKGPRILRYERPYGH